MVLADVGPDVPVLGRGLVVAARVVARRSPGTTSMHVTGHGKISAGTADRAVALQGVYQASMTADNPWGDTKPPRTATLLASRPVYMLQHMEK